VFCWPSSHKPQYLILFAACLRDYNSKGTALVNLGSTSCFADSICIISNVRSQNACTKSQSESSNLNSSRYYIYSSAYGTFKYYPPFHTNIMWCCDILKHATAEYESHLLPIIVRVDGRGYEDVDMLNTTQFTRRLRRGLLWQ
jgi:hypothetical protein